MSIGTSGGWTYSEEVERESEVKDLDTVLLLRLEDDTEEMDTEDELVLDGSGPGGPSSSRMVD